MPETRKDELRRAVKMREGRPFNMSRESAIKDTAQWHRASEEEIRQALEEDDHARQIDRLALEMRLNY